MNPLDFTGPEFLAFYCVLAGVTLCVAVATQRGRESRPGETHPPLTDPYLVAYLRGGTNAALRVATVGLLDRGLLRVSGGELYTAQPDAAEAVTSPLEKAILRRLKTARSAEAMFRDPTFESATAELRETLERRGLLPDEGARRRRQTDVLITVGILSVTALSKIVVAVARGRSNVGFLIVLTAVMLVAAWVLLLPRRTPLGDRAVEDLRSLFGRVRVPRTGHAAAETVFIAAVFGVGYLPASHEARQFYKRSAQGSGSSCGNTTCGSSCGSSCGSGCGGGGCGGCGS